MIVKEELCFWGRRWWLGGAFTVYTHIHPTDICELELEKWLKYTFKSNKYYYLFHSNTKRPKVTLKFKDPNDTALFFLTWK
jgi:hypothetical protein